MEHRIQHGCEQFKEGALKEFKSFYKIVSGSEGNRCMYNTRLDTYGRGCMHDCSYCYAKSLLSFRGLWDSQDPAVADIGKIERKLKLLPKGTILRLGGMTDCFQPAERTHRVTYETIKLLNKYGIGYLIVTKSDLVADDLYIAAMDKERIEPEKLLSLDLDALFSDQPKDQTLSAEELESFLQGNQSTARYKETAGLSEDIDTSGIENDLLYIQLSPDQQQRLIHMINGGASDEELMNLMKETAGETA